MITLSAAARARIEENIETLIAMGDADDRQEAADLTMLLKAHDAAAGLLGALRWYANPQVYAAHPHGLAFDDRDLSYHARAAIAAAGEKQ